MICAERFEQCHNPRFDQTEPQHAHKYWEEFISGVNWLKRIIHTEETDADQYFVSLACSDAVSHVILIRH